MTGGSIKDKIKPDTILKVCHCNDDDDEVAKNQGLENPRYLLGYWSIRGLGAPLRMMLSAAKVDHWILLYDVTEKDENGGWLKESYFQDKAYLKENYNPLMNLPFLIDCQNADDDFCLAQTNAIFSYLGRDLNLLGSTKEETARCEELLCEIMDLRNQMVRFAYAGNVDKAKEDGTRLVTRTVKGILDKLELYLSTKYNKESPSSSTDNVCYLVGSSCTAPDFHLWEMLDQYDGLGKFFELGEDSALAKRPYLSAFRENFAKLPENAAYLKSMLAEDLPYNNPYARFGSDPQSMGPYQRGQETPWKGKGIIEDVRTADSNKRQKVEDS